MQLIPREGVPAAVKVPSFRSEVAMCGPVASLPNPIRPYLPLSQMTWFVSASGATAFSLRAAGKGISAP